MRRRLHRRALRNAARLEEEQRVQEYNQQLEGQTVTRDQRIAELQQKLSEAAIAEREAHAAYLAAGRSYRNIYAELLRAQQHVQ